jgi:hypothetical protein
MLRKLAVALLVMGAPALAGQSETQRIQVDASGQAYKIKKVCRTVEVSGSFIPRTSCVNKKIPVQNPGSETQEAANVVETGSTAPAVDQKEQ